MKRVILILFGMLLFPAAVYGQVLISVPANVSEALISGAKGEPAALNSTRNIANSTKLKGNGEIFEMSRGESLTGDAGFPAGGAPMPRDADSVAETVQPAVGRAIFADQYGADNTCTNDSSAAITAAFVANPSSTVMLKGCYRASHTVVVPSDSMLEGRGFNFRNPSTGTRIICDAGVSPCVQVGDGGNLKSASLRGVTVTRVSGTPRAGDVGVEILDGYAVSLVDVQIQNHGVCLKLKAHDTTGIQFMGTRVYTGACLDTHVLIDTWPEARFSQSRFGENGRGDYDANTYVRLQGGSTVNPATGPNTVEFVNTQFNQGSGSVKNLMQFVNFNKEYISDVGIFKFTGCHAEKLTESVIKSDGSIRSIDRIYFGNTEINSPVEFWSLSTGATLSNFGFTGGYHAGSFTLGQAAAVTSISVSGAKISGPLSLTSGNSSSNASFSGNIYGGSITLAGPWQSLLIQGVTGSKTTLLNTASGTWAVQIPGVNRRTWTPYIYFDTGNIGISYASQNGIVEIVGNEVVAQFEIVLSKKGVSSGNLYIGGLPENVSGGVNADSSDGSGGYATYYTNLRGLTGALIFRTPYQNKADVYQASSTGLNRVTYENITNNTKLAGTIRFFR